MVVSINQWIKIKAIKYRRIIDRSHKYSLWDRPTEVCAGLSTSSIERIEYEVALLDIEEAWGQQERLLAESQREANRTIKSLDVPAQIIRLA